MDAATLEVTETEVLERENARLRAALTVVENQAALLMGVADCRKQPTLALGFDLLAGIAHDALEAA